MMDVMQNYT